MHIHMGGCPGNVVKQINKCQSNLCIMPLSGGFPGGTNSKEPTLQCRRHIRDRGSAPGSGRSLGEENGNPLQYSCLESPRDRGAWGLQSIGSQRVRQGWSNLTTTPIS